MSSWPAVPRVLGNGLVEKDVAESKEFICVEFYIYIS